MAASDYHMNGRDVRLGAARRSVRVFLEREAAGFVLPEREAATTCSRFSTARIGVLSGGVITLLEYARRAENKTELVWVGILGVERIPTMRVS